MSARAPVLETPAGAPATTRAASPWNRVLRGTSWVAVYLLLVALPLLVLLTGELPRGGGYWWDFAMALGFGGLAMMGLQSALTARFRRATAPFGADIIYYFHRWTAVVAFGFIAGHYAILRLRYAEALGPMDPRQAPWHMTSGRVAASLFAALLVTSLARKALRIEYDRWRAAHAIMAVAAVVGAMLHVWGVGYYTEAAWKGTVWTGYTVFWLLVVGYVRIVRPYTLRRTPYRVVGVERERGRSWTVTVAPDGHAGLEFKPGQFAWLTLRSTPFRAKEHPFSFSGSAAQPNELQFTIKELGDFTRTIGTLQPGERAYVDGPHGVFTVDLYPRAAPLVFIAGGIGIAPIMSMLRTLAERGDRRPMRLIYGNRSWENEVFREALDALTARLDLAVVHVLQEPPADWRGVRGVLSEDVLRGALGESDLAGQFFICGPKAMSDAVQRTLRRRGVPLHHVHCELFDMV